MPPACSAPAEQSLDEAIAFVQTKPAPLALYVFTSEAATARRVLDSVPSGNALINDVVVQFASPALPFGGIGPSGMGSLHGKFYFEACTQKRGVMTKGCGPATRALDLQVKLRAPPYTRLNVALARFLVVNVPVMLPARYGHKALAALLLFLGCKMVLHFGWHAVVLRFVCTAILESLA